MAFQVPSSKGAMRPPTPILSQPRPCGQGEKKKNSWVKGLVTLIIVIIIIGGGVYLIADFAGINLPFAGSTVAKGEWQAVFLSNGQVYFGKVAKITEDYVFLKNIYYLQVVTQPLQRSQEGEEATTDQTAQTEQRLTLMKLGNEIHGPKDEMMINRDHVIIIEDLKSDGRVVQAIKDYISQGNK